MFKLNQGAQQFSYSQNNALKQYAVITSTGLGLNSQPTNVDYNYKAFLDNRYNIYTIYNHCTNSGTRAYYRLFLFCLVPYWRSMVADGLATDDADVRYDLSNNDCRPAL